MTQVPYKVARNRWGGISYYYKPPPPRFQILERCADHYLVSTMLQWRTWPEGASRTRCKVYKDGRLEVWSPETKQWIDSKKTCLKRRGIRDLHCKVFAGEFVYETKADLPATIKRGTNVFVTEADPYNHGWWKSTGPSFRRLLPNYHCPYTDYSRESRLWPSETALFHP